MQRGREKPLTEERRLGQAGRCDQNCSLVRYMELGCHSHPKVRNLRTERLGPGAARRALLILEVRKGGSRYRQQGGEAAHNIFAKESVRPALSRCPT